MMSLYLETSLVVNNDRPDYILLMHLYNLSLQGPTAINQAITGSFSASKQYEVVISRGAKILELLRYNDTSKSLEVVCS